MTEAKIELPEPGLFSGFLSILFPVRCVHCGREGNWLCPDCAAGLKAIGPRTCPRCGCPASRKAGAGDACGECRDRPLHFQKARAAFCYEGPARSIVHRLKYTGQRRLAGFMAAMTRTAAAGLTAYLKGATLTYVPLHRSKQLDRGFNQSGLFAEALSRKLDLPLGDFLIKKRPTASQNQLDSGSRMTNLSGSFALRQRGRREGRPRGGRLVLVDDVYTTGATVSECARVLKDGFGVDVDVLTFARSLKRRSLAP